MLHSSQMSCAGCAIKDRKSSSASALRRFRSACISTLLTVCGPAKRAERWPAHASPVRARHEPLAAPSRPDRSIADQRAIRPEFLSTALDLPWLLRDLQRRASRYSVNCLCASITCCGSANGVNTMAYWRRRTQTSRWHGTVRCGRQAVRSRCGDVVELQSLKGCTGQLRSRICQSFGMTVAHDIRWSATRPRVRALDQQCRAGKDGQRCSKLASVARRKFSVSRHRRASRWKGPIGASRSDERPDRAAARRVSEHGTFGYVDGLRG